jgi:hypothetical protein
VFLSFDDEKNVLEAGPYLDARNYSKNRLMREAVYTGSALSP